MGKTRLAMEVACRLAPSPVGGMWLVELARIEPTEDPERVAEAVASVFDVAPQPGQIFTEAVRRRLRNARLLVVLDNGEHVAPAAAAFADALLSGCSGVSVLATSQWPLGVPGEQVWPLGPLSLPGGGRRGRGRTRWRSSMPGPGHPQRRHLNRIVQRSLPSRASPGASA